MDGVLLTGILAGEAFGRNHPMSLRLIAALAALLLATAPIAADEAFPNRPIRLVVPFATGGPSDIVARLLAPRMTAMLGQPIIVEARPGAGGVTGMDVVAKAPADGYTIGLGSAGGMAISPGLLPNMPYDTLRDFAPLTLAVLVPEPLIVPAARPWRSLGDLIAAARAKPGTLNYASAGPGSMPHLAGELLKLAAGIDLTHIPYKGGAPLTLALVAGEADLGFADLPILLPHLKAGTLRALAFGGAERFPLLPEVPTFAELGLPQVRTDNWHGLFAPARTPEPILTALHRAALAALEAPETLRILNEQGAIPRPMSREAFAGFVREELQRWADVIRNAGVKPD